MQANPVIELCPENVLPLYIYGIEKKGVICYNVNVRAGALTAVMPAQRSIPFKEDK